ncbi:MAG: hypothetical protein ACXVJ7_17215 [Acidimicrobiia bacterium]
MLETLLRDARSLVATLDLEDLSGCGARELVRGFAELERVAAAGKLLAAGRLVASGVGPTPSRESSARSRAPAPSPWARPTAWRPIRW